MKPFGMSNEELRSRLRGGLHEPGDPEYADTCTLMVHPAERGRELLRLFRDVMVDAPDELGLAFAYITAPAEPGIPDTLHGQPVVIVAGCTPAGRGRRARPARDPNVRSTGSRFLRADRLCRLPVLARRPSRLPKPLDRRAHRRPLRRGHRRDCPSVRADPGQPLPAVHRPLGWPSGPDGARVVAGGGAPSRLHRPSTSALGRPRTRHPHARARTGLRRGPAALLHRRHYLNFRGDEGSERVRAGFGASYERLIQVKTAWDPDNVFRGNQLIRPLTTA